MVHMICGVNKFESLVGAVLILFPNAEARTRMKPLPTCTLFSLTAAEYFSW